MLLHLLRLKFVFLFFCFLSAEIIQAQVIKEALHYKWIKVAVHDPYSDYIKKGVQQASKIDTINYKSTYQFESDGSLLYTDNWNKHTGKWNWNGDSTRIGIHYTNYNGQEREDIPITDFRFSILKLTEDTLIIGWQGRHGFVRESMYIRMQNNSFLNLMDEIEIKCSQRFQCLLNM